MHPGCCFSRTGLPSHDACFARTEYRKDNTEKKNVLSQLSIIFNYRNLLSPMLFLSAKKLGELFFCICVLATRELFTSRTSCGGELYNLTRCIVWKKYILMCLLEPASCCCYLVSPRSCAEEVDNSWPLSSFSWPLMILQIYVVSSFLEEKVLVYSVILWMKKSAPQTTSRPCCPSWNFFRYWSISLRMSEKDQNCKNYPSSGQNGDLGSSITMSSACFFKNAEWSLDSDDCALSWSLC